MHSVYASILNKSRYLRTIVPYRSHSVPRSSALLGQWSHVHILGASLVMLAGASLKGWTVTWRGNDAASGREHRPFVAQNIWRQAGSTLNGSSSCVSAETIARLSWRGSNGSQSKCSMDASVLTLSGLVTLMKPFEASALA